VTVNIVTLLGQVVARAFIVMTPEIEIVKVVIASDYV
jgi:hypothetical protein